MIIKGGYLIIVSGPSGSGKSTITKFLLEQVKNLDFRFHVPQDKRGQMS